MALTVQQLYEAVRAGEGAPSGTALTDFTRLLAYSNAAVTLYAPLAPDNVQDVAVVQLASWLYDADVSVRRTPANALSESGARAVLAPYRIHALSPSGNVARAVSGSAPVDRNTVESVVRSVVASWALKSSEEPLPVERLPDAAQVQASNEGIALGAAALLDFTGSGVDAALAGSDLTVTVPGFQPTPHQSAVFNAFRDGAWTPVAGIATATPFVTQAFSTVPWDYANLGRANFVLAGNVNVTEAEGNFGIRIPKTIASLAGLALQVGERHEDLDGSQGLVKVGSDGTYDFYSLALTDLVAGRHSIAVARFTPFRLRSQYIDVSALRAMAGSSAEHLIESLADPLVVGLAVPDAVDERYLPAVSFDPAFTPTDDDSGVLIFNVEWAISAPSVAGLQVVDVTNTTQTVFTRQLRAGGSYAGNNRSGIEVSQAGVTDLDGNLDYGTMYLYVSLTANGSAAMYQYWLPGSAGSVGFTLTARCSVELFRNGGAPAAAPPAPEARSSRGVYIGRWTGLPRGAPSGNTFGAELDFTLDAGAPDRFTKTSPAGTYEDLYEDYKDSSNKKRPADNVIGLWFQPQERTRANSAAAWGDWEDRRQRAFMPLGPGAIAEDVQSSGGASFAESAYSTLFFRNAETLTVAALLWADDAAIVYRLHSDRRVLASISATRQYSVAVYEAVI